jgi:hypothetical protein
VNLCFACNWALFGREIQDTRYHHQDAAMGNDKIYKGSCFLRRGAIRGFRSAGLDEPLNPHPNSPGLALPQTTFYWGSDTIMKTFRYANLALYDTVSTYPGVGGRGAIRGD